MRLFTRANQSLGQVILILILSLIFCIAIIAFLFTSGPSLFQTFREALGLGMSLEDFQNSVSQLDNRANQPIPTDKKLEQYQQIVTLWDKFSDSRSASDIDVDTRKIIIKAYTQLLNGYTISFNSQNCKNVAADPNQINTYQKACEKLFTVYESSAMTHMPVPLTEAEYRAMDDGVAGIQQGFHAAQGTANLDSAIHDKICTSMMLANDVCITLDAQATANNIAVATPACATRSFWVSATVDFQCPNAELDAPGTG